MLAERARGSHTERTPALGAGRGSVASRDGVRAGVGPSEVDGDVAGVVLAGDQPPRQRRSNGIAVTEEHVYQRTVHSSH